VSRSRWPRVCCLLPGLVLVVGCATAFQSGQTALHEGRYAAAAARFADVLARDPERSDALFGLGLARYRMGAFDAAVGALSWAVLAAPDVVVSATPLDLAGLIAVNKPVVRARYEFADGGEPTLASVVHAFLARPTGG